MRAFITGWAVGALVLGNVMGCIEAPYTSLGEGALPGDPLAPTGAAACECNCEGGGSGDDGVLEVEDLTGQGYRFDTLALTSPLEGAIADGVNDYFDEELAAGTLNVLLRVEEHDAGTLLFSVGAGEPVDGGGFALGDDAEALEASLSGARFTTTAPAYLVFPVELFTPPELPISELELGGKLSPDGQTISEGVLEGVLTGEDAARIQILGLDLATTLGTMGIEPSVDLDDDGAAESYVFTGTFTAAPAVLQ